MKLVANKIEQLFDKEGQTLEAIIFCGLLE